MQSTQALTTIDRELQTARIAVNDSTLRARIADAVKRTGEYFGQEQAIRLRAKIARGYVGGAADEALEQALLSGKWVDIDREMRAAPKDPNEKREDSHLRHVTEANPYGWARPEQQRSQLDHDIPGDWNSFRQTHNLTASERETMQARDHRVRGCTRWEVLGVTDHPSVEYDAQAVANATARAQFAMPGISTGAVYGEGAA